MPGLSDPPPVPSRPPPHAVPVERAEASLGPLLRTLAESLDVREIFARISAEARRIVPHDFLMFGLLNADRSRARVMALSGDMSATPSEVDVPQALRGAIDEGDFIMSDVALSPEGRGTRGRLRIVGRDAVSDVDYETQPFLRRIVAERHIRSYMRISVRLRGGMLGGLIFCSTEPAAYDDAAAARARTIADCVALAVAHQRLAEEEQRAVEARDRATRLEARVQRLTEELAQQGRHRILGGSRRWRDVLAQATKVATTEATVLLSGESGTGKEVIARFIHRASPRAEGPFVALNCAALPEQLLESELFGHEKGAFTGAVSARAGRIEQAAGGVLFLDEVGEMSAAVQAKFLRVLQEREFERLGGERTLKADIRVLAATNRDLKVAIGARAFREDLYYRLGVFDVALPPLRERPEDIDLLFDAFVDEVGRAVARPCSGVAQEVRDKLAAYTWPGNVRELRNVVERALILCDGGRMTREHLPTDIAAASKKSARDPALAATAATPARTLEASERKMIVDALARAGNNKSKAARLLGLTRAQLRARIEKHGLAPAG
jgi:transcriptional regulator with GAF, ATPase, and Fis domain